MYNSKYIRVISRWIVAKGIAIFFSGWLNNSALKFKVFKEENKIGTITYDNISNFFNILKNSILYVLYIL